MKAEFSDVPYWNATVTEKCKLCNREKSVMYIIHGYENYKALSEGRISYKKELLKNTTDEALITFLKDMICPKCQRKRLGKRLSNYAKNSIVK